MNILCISQEESGISSIQLLDWITSRDVNRGVNHEKYWIINTDTQLDNRYNDVEVDKLGKLLAKTLYNEYQSIMIKKHEQITSKREDPPSTNKGSEETPISEVPPAPVDITSN